MCAEIIIHARGDTRREETRDASKNATPPRTLRGVVKITPAKGVETKQGASLGAASFCRSQTDVRFSQACFRSSLFLPLPRATSTLQCDRSPRGSSSLTTGVISLRGGMCSLSLTLGAAIRMTKSCDLSISAVRERRKETRERVGRSGPNFHQADSSLVSECSSITETISKCYSLGLASSFSIVSVRIAIDRRFYGRSLGPISSFSKTASPDDVFICLIQMRRFRIASLSLSFGRRETSPSREQH